MHCVLQELFSKRESKSITGFSVGGLSGLSHPSLYFLGSVNPGGTGPLDDLQYWRSGSRSPIGEVLAKMLGHAPEVVGQSLGRLVILKKYELSLSSVHCPLVV